MKNFNLLILCFCLIYCYFAEASETTRRSVQKCSSYGKAIYIYDDVSSKKCALTDLKDVVQGVQVKAKELPHLALIGYPDEDGKDTFPCMGSLISENFVITVAHCTYNPRSGKPTKVRLGDFAGELGNDGQSQELDIAAVIVHPDYKLRSHLNDIALLKLKGNAQLNIYVRPACLYPKTDISQTQGLYAGQGNQEASIIDVTETRILHIRQDILPNEKCLKAYPPSNRKFYAADGSHLCVISSYQRPNHNCQGESGSALVVKSHIACMYEIVGLGAYGKSCLVSNIPEVHTNVPYHLDWIENVVWPVEVEQDTNWTWPGKF